MNKKKKRTTWGVKEEVFDAFEKGIDRRKIWKMFPDLEHKTIRTYYWEWKKLRERKRIEENPMYVIGELVRDILKPTRAPKPKPKPKEEHVKKPTIKPEPVSISNAAQIDPVKNEREEPVVRKGDNAPETPFISPLQKRIRNPFSEKHY